MSLPGAKAPAFEEKWRAFARAEGLVDAFPDEVLAEVEAFEREPGTDDSTLVDWREIPFVTVDGPFTKDLDQALFVERRATSAGAGFHLLYAIADAAYYVTSAGSGTSAILTEALRRGSSFYFPAFSIPMLPRQLSEGLVSLNENADRRALVFDVELDPAGTVTSQKLVRARVRSRRKLTFEAVDLHVETPARSPLAGEPFAESISLFIELGNLRAHHPGRQEMVRYRRPEVEVTLGRDGKVVIQRGSRSPAERATEEISILANAIGARFLQGGDPETIQPVYKVHPAPLPDRVEAFERLVKTVAKEQGLPDDPWVYRRAAVHGMAGYLESLPTEGPRGRLAKALHRQAMLLNGKSYFAAEAAEHFGVGEALYSRFTAPMREMVGVFCHKEALERLNAGSRSRPRHEDEALRAQVIEAANRAKATQKKIDREVDAQVVEAILAPDLALPIEQRTTRTGTVMGITGGGLHVTLDDPPIDVRVLSASSALLWAVPGW